MFCFSFSFRAPETTNTRKGPREDGKIQSTFGLCLSIWKMSRVFALSLLKEEKDEEKIEFPRAWRWVN
jgi:hypothetical protein